MPKDLKNFDLEKIFTKRHYAEFRKAVENREDYEFLHSKPGTYHAHPSTGVMVSITGRKCDNGVWKDDYLYGYHFQHGNGGCGRAYDPEDKILSYEEWIDEIHSGLRVPPKKQKQVDFFDIVENNESIVTDFAME